jgi:2-C-methyl-D-erythritol 4-phosphate cytidylyltransferase/2-C-methyl-D-erythritol 2,4-cyclodiphosphate synthase
VRKQLLTLGGRPILERSVSLFAEHPAVDEIIVAVPPDITADPPAYLVANRKPIRIVGGGARRQDSVANAFAVVDERCELVVIHDAARPFATADLVSRTIAAAAESGAAVAAVRARDTVKRSMWEPSSAAFVKVAETNPRDTIYLAQTPQAFRRDVLERAIAHGRNGAEGTDEAALAEQIGSIVLLVPGDPRNIKITTMSDLAFARGLLLERGEPT